MLGWRIRRGVDDGTNAEQHPDPAPKTQPNASCFPWAAEYFSRAVVFRPVAYEPPEVPMSTQMELRHLAREVKTGLELAIAAFAPSDLIDRLAIAAGLLDAITDMALDQAATLPLVASTVERAHQAVAAWQQWRNDHLPKATA
jgi:hypothetical protein